MQNTSETKQSEEQALKLPDGATLVKDLLDPEQMLKGTLWLLMPSGRLINVMVEPQSFDAAVTQYVDLPDRVNWPVAHRGTLLTQCQLPVYYIPPENLSEEQRKEVETVTKTGDQT